MNKNVNEQDQLIRAMHLAVGFTYGPESVA